MEEPTVNTLLSDISGNKKANDLERFAVIFDYPISKVYSNKVEYRSVSSLDKVVSHARSLITSQGLKLSVVANGELASTRSFQVMAL